MNRFSGYRDQNAEESVFFKYISQWYHVAIREMALLPDFSTEPEWIQKRLHAPVPLQQIREALRFLLESGYLIQKKNGMVRSGPQKNGLGRFFALCGNPKF